MCFSANKQADSSVCRQHISPAAQFNHTSCRKLQIYHLQPYSDSDCKSGHWSPGLFCYAELQLTADRPRQQLKFDCWRADSRAAVLLEHRPHCVLIDLVHPQYLHGKLYLCRRVPAPFFAFVCLDIIIDFPPFFLLLQHYF